jgi:hypothetical protein
MFACCGHLASGICTPMREEHEVAKRRDSADVDDIPANGLTLNASRARCFSKAKLNEKKKKEKRKKEKKKE